MFWAFKQLSTTFSAQVPRVRSHVRSSCSGTKNPQKQLDPKVLTFSLKKLVFFMFNKDKLLYIWVLEISAGISLY